MHSKCLLFSTLYVAFEYIWTFLQCFVISQKHCFPKIPILHQVVKIYTYFLCTISSNQELKPQLHFQHNFHVLVYDKIWRKYIYFRYHKMVNLSK